MEDTTVALGLGKGAQVTGRIVVEGNGPVDFTQLPLAAVNRYRGSDSQLLAQNTLPFRVNPDGTFVVSNVVGQVEFSSNRPNLWQVQSVMHEGRSLLDSPLELFAAARI